MSPSFPLSPGSLSLRTRRPRPGDPIGRAATTVVEILEGRRLMSVSTVGTVAPAQEGTEYTLHLQRNNGETDILVNWGDGTPDEPHTFVDDTLDLTHTYVDEGDGSVDVTVTSGGVGTGGDLEVIADVKVAPFNQGSGQPQTGGAPSVMAAGPAGTFVTAATASVTNEVVVTRHKADGTLDDTFGGDGIVSIGAVDENSVPEDGMFFTVGGVFVSQDVTFVGTTYMSPDGRVSPRILRIAADGTPMSSFTLVDTVNTQILLYGIAPAGGGGAVFTGLAGPKAVVGKLVPDGDSLILDTTFTPTGYVVESFDEEDVNDMDPSVDAGIAVTVAGSQIVVAGQGGAAGSGSLLAVARYELMGGQRTSVTFTDVVVDPNMSIVPAAAAGSDVLVATTLRPQNGTASDFLLARFDASGLDASFLATTDVNGDGDEDAGFARALFTSGENGELQNEDIAFGLSVIEGDAVVTGFSDAPDESNDYSFAVATFDAETGATTGQIQFDEHTDDAEPGDDPDENAEQIYGRVAVAGSAPGTIDVAGFAEAPADYIGRGVVVATLGRGPGGTPTDPETLEVAVTVQNVAPTVTLTAPTGLVRSGDEALEFTYTLGDAGALDTFVASVDFGDGIGARPITLEPGTNTFYHSYAAGGRYTVTLEVTDEDGGTASDTALPFDVVAITQPADGGGLTVSTTPGPDEILLTRTESTATLSSPTSRLFATSAVTAAEPGWSLSVNGVPFPIDAIDGRVTIIGGEGNDLVSLSGFTLGADVFGGDGDDRIFGGNGGGLLVGGYGNDLLNGGGERDILIGGWGRDCLVAGGGEDVLIAGRTDYDDKARALNALRETWQRRDRTFSQRVSSLANGNGVDGGYALRTDGGNQTVFDDGVSDKLAVDLLVGGGSADWYLYNYQQAGATDVVLGLGNGDSRSDIDPT